jgi:hypothetical protein
LAFTQFVEPLLRMLPAMVGSTDWPFLQFLPGAAGEAVAGESVYSAMDMISGAQLSGWAGTVTLVAYGVVLAGLGYVTAFRKDVA